MTLRKQKRVDEAKERQEKYNKLSTQQKINALDEMFGKKIGAKKQREKLNKKLAQEAAKDFIDTAKGIKEAEKQGKRYQKPKRS